MTVAGRMYPVDDPGFSRCIAASGSKRLAVNVDPWNARVGDTIKEEP
jgi:hypothetical protein